MIGIKNGMVMQRNGSGVCEIALESDTALQNAEYSGADGIPRKAEITKKDGSYVLSGIPVGGPYTVTAGGQNFTDIYVGDLWILAGQSNMQGVGWLEPEDRMFKGCPDVRALFMNDEWGAAKHPLHELWKAVDKVHTVEFGASGEPPDFNNIGPGLAFGIKMRDMAGVPQGLLCCAHGGTSMAQWSPAIKNLGCDKSLYAAMERRFKTNGSHVRGMFWYQGCSDTSRDACMVFDEAMKGFIGACRKDFYWDAELPIVQVQIGRFVFSDTDNGAEYWNAIREKQRLISTSFSKVATVSAIGKGLDDLIHIDRQGQIELGREAAEAMYNILYGSDYNGCLPPPAFGGIADVKWDPLAAMTVIDLRFDNLHGGLTSQGRPEGFAVITNALTFGWPEMENIPDWQCVVKIRLINNIARIYIQIEPEKLKGSRLYYGCGLNPYCNITDYLGRSIPAFGPVIL